MATTEALPSDESDTRAREQIRRAFNRFSELVQRVAAGAGDDAGPCVGWTVREVLVHTTSEDLWAAAAGGRDHRVGRRGPRRRRARRRPGGGEGQNGQR